MRLRTSSFVLAVVASLALSAPAPAAQKGVVAGGDLSALAQEAGAGWVRLFVQWKNAEPAQGRLDLANTQALVDAYAARGIKVYLVVFDTPGWANGNRGDNVPPTSAADYGSFLGRLAAAMGTKVGAYEIWNEPDGDDGVFFAGSVGDYAELLKAAYGPIKRNAPHAKVLTAGLVGNNVGYVEKLYALGAGPSFDAVSVHTDTACLDKGPDFFYREPDGRIGRYSFTGYREIRRVMEARGDGAKTIWMTELGWNTKVATCDQGASKGDANRKAGVSKTEQAANLTRAYQCLSQDPYVEVATWFELVDRAAGAAALSTNYFGLVESDGTRKPAFAAFQRVGDDRGKECGGYIDVVKPTLTVRAPTAGTKFSKTLAIDVLATDDRVLRDIDLIVGGVRVAKGIEQGADKTKGALRFTWFGAGKLAKGRHTLTFRATDEVKNVTETTVVVEKVGVGQESGGGAAQKVALKASYGKVRGRTMTVKGTIRAADRAAGKPGGKLQVQFDRYDAKTKRFKKFSRFTYKASKGRFAKRYRFRKPGRWRVIVRYVPSGAPFAKATLKPKVVRVR